MAAEFRVFLSAVTSEFGAARDAVANDLQARDLQLRVQRSFRQEPGADTLLRLLHDYIRDCSAVVCVIGTRSGACPSPAAAADFAHLLPPGITQASYTQWEFFFARAHKRRLSLYIAAADYRPDRDAPSGDDFSELQAAFIRHIKAAGLHYVPFSNRDQLRAEVLKEPWPEEPRAKPIILPYASLGSLFKGREVFLRRLRQSLTRADGGGTTAIVSKALYGMGGIGKTRAAAEYAWAYAEDYSALLFVIAETPEALRRNLAGLAGPLLLPQRDAPEEEVRLRAVLDWLKTNPPWLLILDNVDTQQALAATEEVLKQLAGGHVLITSRLANLPADVEPLELDLLDIRDAGDFLLERTARRRRAAADDEAMAGDLAVDLGRLALALEHAGAYIVRHTASFAQYRGLWRGNRDKVISWSDPSITHYPRAIAVTWQTSVAQLTDPARHLLERLAWLAPEPVPEFLLDVAIPQAEGQDLNEAVADLAAYSLATRDIDNPRFLVHRLVQDVTRRSLDAAASRQRITEALGWVNAAFDGDPADVRAWSRLDPLAPHAQSVTQWADGEEIAEPTARLMNQLGQLFFTKSLHTQAEGLFLRALAVDEASFGSLHPLVGIRLDNLATLLRTTNRLAEAEPLHRRALAIHEASFGPNHPAVAICLKNLAQLLQATNRLGDAEPFYRRALAINTANFGPNHPKVAGCLNDLAGLLQDTNRFPEAERLYRRALAIDEMNFGLDHPEIAAGLNNLAGLLRDTNRLTEAEPLMRKALAIDEASFGPGHPRVAICLNNLAGLLQTANRLAEAEPLYRRAIAIDETSFGPDHPTVATCLSNLAELLRVTNRLSQAEPLMRRALTITEASFGQNHPTVAIDLNNLATLLRATNRLAEAEPLMRRVLAILVEFERKTGYPHPHRDDALGNYAGLLAAMGKSKTEINAALAGVATGGA
jgi:tetratricopeptide (TPR) repeat protein